MFASRLKRRGADKSRKDYDPWAFCAPIFASPPYPCVFLQLRVRKRDRLKEEEREAGKNERIKKYKKLKDRTT